MSASTSKNPVKRIAEAIETVRRDRGEVQNLDLIALGFTMFELDAFGIDARSLHARTYPNVVAA